MIARRLIICLLLVVAACLIAPGCRKPGASEEATGLQIIAEGHPSTWVIRTEKSLLVYELPSGRRLHSGPDEEVLAVWADGMLKAKDSTVDWLDLEPESGEYVSNPGVDLTSWNTPVAVDPEARIIYAFEHSVPPTRVIKAHYLDGRDPEHSTQHTAEEFETLHPLPVNGWMAFYVDRPSHAGAITPEEIPTRRLRVNHGRLIGGEFPEALGVYFLRDCVVVNQMEQGWLLLEDGAPGVVDKRTMSLGQIAGSLRPLARDENTILIAADELSDDGETVVGSSLYSYGAYTRQVSEIWDPSAMDGRWKILSLTVREHEDYYIVLGSLPDARTIMLVRLFEGEVEEFVRFSSGEPVVDATLFLTEADELELSLPIEVSAMGEGSMEDQEYESHEEETGDAVFHPGGIIESN